MRRQIALFVSSFCLACSPNSPRPDPSVVIEGAVVAGPQTPSDASTMTVGLLAAGGQYSCVTRESGLWCWGWLPPMEPLHGQKPYRIELENVRHVSIASLRACAVSGQAEVWCWGRLDDKADHYDATPGSKPQKVPGLPRIAKVAVSDRFACAIGEDGSVWCWGAGGKGQLGTGSPQDSSAPVLATALPPVKDLVSAARGACARTDKGEVWCWGDVSGYGFEPQPVPRQVMSFAENLFGSHQVVCAADLNHNYSCWGSNYDGIIRHQADQRRQSFDDPQPVAELVGAVAVAPGDDGMCSLTTAGGVRCRGTNFHGVLGANLPSQVFGIAEWDFVDVAVISDATAVARGEGHACALLKDATVWCWGSKWTRNPKTEKRLKPSIVPGLEDVHDIAAGRGATCAVKGDGTVWCWGRGPEGQMGTGDRLDSAVPIQARGVVGAKDITMGMHTVCARSPSKTWCWGAATRGKTSLFIAPGEDGMVSSPVVVPAETYDKVDALTLSSKGKSLLPELGKTVTSAVGRTHACGLIEDGSVRCVGGRNVSGQLGDPGSLKALRARALAVGAYFNCVITRERQVACWGSGDQGQFGDGALDYHPAPVKVPLPDAH